MSERNLNVAVICPGCGGSGAVANVALHQSAELAKYFRVQLVSDGLPPKPAPGVVQRPIRPPIFRQLRRFAHVPREAAFALWAKAAVRRLHAKQAVDAVICHGHPVAALAAAPLTRGLGIPFILVTHGDIFDRPRGTYDPLLTRFYRQVTRPAYRGAARIVALSPHMQQLAVAGGAQPDRVVVIPNGLDPTEIGLPEDEADCAQPAMAAGPVRLLYVGRLSVEKGVDVLIDAAARLNEQGVPFNLRIVGTGPEEARLRTQTASLGLAGAIDFLGGIPRHQLGALYRTADIVCVPSRSDTLPTVVLEAMAAGVAVVGSETGGIPFLLLQGQAGWLVPTDVPAELANILTRLAEYPDTRTAKCRLASELVRDRFSWAANASAVANLISQASR